ncbi:MAG: GNAT family N-acetyltransferase [Nannocystaceae bacterium]
MSTTDARDSRTIHRRPATDDHAARLAFARAHPCPRAPASTIPRFLEALASGPAGIFDLHDERGPVALAVVVDTCDNRDDAADLVLLGLRDGALAAPVLAALVDGALAHVAAGPRRALDLTLDPALLPHRAALVARGLRFAYATHRMRRTRPSAPQPRAPLPSGARFVAVDVDRVDGYYEVVRAAFAEVPGASVPSREAFCAISLARADPGRRQLLVVDDRVVGFSTISVDEGPSGRAGEVHSLGRDPAWRGSGLGEHLLGEALRLLEAAQVDTVELEVAAVNASALALYQRFGFEVVETLEVLRAPLR